MLLHTYASTNTTVHPQERMQRIIPLVDMVEPAWDTPEDGAQITRAYGMKPGALLIAYRTLAVAATKPVVGELVDVPDEWCIHHKDGRVWRANETGYSQTSTARFLNPAHPAVLDAALVDQAYLAGLGFAGVRYDEAAVGWLAHNSPDYTDCVEFINPRQCMMTWQLVCRKLREARRGWIQLPSINGFTDRTWALPIQQACAGVSAENFPAGPGGAGSSGQSVSFRAAERNIVGTAYLADLLSYSSLKYTAMFYAQYGLGLTALHDMVRDFNGCRVFFNVDSLRLPDGGLPTWVG